MFGNLRIWFTVRHIATRTNQQHTNAHAHIFTVTGTGNEWVETTKGTGKRGHIVADTLLPTQTFPRLPARATFVADTKFVSETQKCFWFCSETFCVRNICFPVCARKETSWATMFPQQCVLVCHRLKNRGLDGEMSWRNEKALIPRPFQL